MKTVLHLVFALCLGLGFTSALAFAQDVQTRGSIGGTVTDANGAAVPGAKVTVAGPQVPRDVTTTENGTFTVENLVPGIYSVTVEQQGFKKAQATNVEVNVGKQSTLALKLEPGGVSEVVTVTDAAASVDPSSTAVGRNLSDQLFQNIPVQRSVTSLFYLAPGANDSLGGGSANPSVSGGSALDNLYIADGVNITDSAFGGLGTFSRSYGSLGTGINTSFVKEVQVKTGGFEPQYGQSEGGIVNIITQSGGNEFHGALYGYARPRAFEATRKQPDDFRITKSGEVLHVENYDVGADFGGPIKKDKLFFFTSFNPTVNRTIVRGAAGSGLLTLLGQNGYARRTRTWNYAEKVDWNISSRHTIAFSLFGDPSRSNKAPFSSLNIRNFTAASVLDYGTRNLAVRYNGALSSTWTVSASVSQNKNHFNETGFDNLNLISDATPTQAFGGSGYTAVGRGFIEPTKGRTWRTEISTLKTINFWGQHQIGVGYQFQKSFYAGTRDRSGPHFTVPTNNATGNNPLPATLPGGQAFAGQDLNAQFSIRIASNTNPATCLLCPVYQVPGLASQPNADIGLGPGNRRVYLLQTRGEFGVAGKNGVFDTFSNYNAGYIQDTWRINKHFTAVLGLRTEQERIVGNPAVTGKRVGYSFTDQWAPRLGVTYDPTGQGRSKIYYNFGRYFEFLPLDLAERSLSTEQDFTSGRFAPVSSPCTIGGKADICATINQYGTVTPVIDNAHFLNRATGGTGTGVSISAQDPSSPIAAGTKLGFAQEHVIGYEQQLKHDVVLSFRYMDRRLKRIVEDAAVVSPEGAFTDLNQVYFIGNVNSKTDVATNPIPFTYAPGTADAAKPAGCRVNSSLPFNATSNPILYDNPEVTDSNGNTVGAICYAPLGKNGQPAGASVPDGVPDGFPDPVHIYKAFTVEVNKRFSNNWQLLSNWTIASLRGNFEGHFRNDNGQTDPGISSLFDFTAGEFNLLGDQFAVGPLNTDRRHVVNIYASYNFSKEGLNGFGRSFHGLTLSPAIHIESGVPVSKLFAHPVYNNAGEIPVGGRGSLGRTPTYVRFDFHADYPWHISETKSLKFVADFFNIFNRTTLRLPDQFFQQSVGVLNPDFQKPASFYAPFNMRLGMRFEF